MHEFHTREMLTQNVPIHEFRTLQNTFYTSELHLDLHLKSTDPKIQSIHQHIHLPAISDISVETKLDKPNKQQADEGTDG